MCVRPKTNAFSEVILTFAVNRTRVLRVVGERQLVARARQRRGRTPAITPIVALVLPLPLPLIPNDGPSTKNRDLFFCVIFRLLFCRQTDELRRKRTAEVFVRAQAHISGERRAHVRCVLRHPHDNEVLCPGRAVRRGHGFQGPEKPFAPVQHNNNNNNNILCTVISNANSPGPLSGRPACGSIRSWMCLNKNKNKTSSFAKII